MGLESHTVRLLVDYFRDKTIPESVVTYGVQAIEGPYPRILKILKRYRYPFKPLADGEVQIDPNTKQWGDTLHQNAFFKLLGFKIIESLDIFENEKPTHLLDLNQPIPQTFHQRYDVVLDGGTMEHCLNVKEVLFNTAKLVKPGGYVIHVNPVSGWINHGFYQFSPTLFYDFYGANGFTECEAWFLFNGWCLKDNPKFTPHDFLGQSTTLVFIARKPESANNTEPIIPIQNAYQTMFGNNHAATYQKGAGQWTFLKKFIPSKKLLHFLIITRQYFKVLAHLMSAKRL